MPPTGDPPAVRSPVPPAWPGAIPTTPGSTLIGRDDDLATLRRLTTPGGHGFVTLAGIGGVGKSRLAVELAMTELDAWQGRVAFVPLDAVREASLVLPAIADALGVADDPGRSTLETLAGALGPEPALLVLDTVEHVRPAAPALANLFDRVPGLTLLATSRIALGIPRERLLRVEPLGVARPSDDDPETLVHTPSVALFLDRARHARPDLEPTPANVLLAAEICRRLDGIPLAIELAAASLRVLAPHQVVAQLEPGFGGPGSGPSPGVPVLGTREAVGHGDDAGPDRQRSLRAAMDWSLGLLPYPVAVLYRRLGVLAGPFSASTAAAILEGGLRRGLPPPGADVSNGLGQLVAATLLRHDRSGAQFVMLGTVRADARDRLARSGEAVAIRWAHAYHLLSVVEEAERDLATDRAIAALDRLDEALDDIREALDWATAAGDGAFVVRLAGSLGEFWRTRGHHTEGRLRLAAALAIGGSAPATDRRKALSAAGTLASYQGDYALGEAYLREALVIARAEGDPETVASVLNTLGTNAYWRGELRDAEPLVQEGLELRRSIGDPAGIAASLNALGGIRHFRGDLDGAREAFAESLALKEQLGNQNSTAVTLSNLGLVERDAGRPEAAVGALHKAIGIWERTGDRQRMSLGTHSAALVSLDLGQLEEAAAALVRAREIAHDLGDRMEQAFASADLVRVEVLRGNLEAATDALAAALPTAVALKARIVIPLVFEGAGTLAAARGDDMLAVRLWSAASAERVASGFANMPADERLLAARVDEVRGRLEPGIFDAAWAKGAALTIDQAAAAAMTLAGNLDVPRDEPFAGTHRGSIAGDDGRAV